VSKERSKNAMAALAYAEVCGLSVFPIAPGTKIPLKGSHGELDGTTDLDTIDSWWRLVPDAGIAVALRFTPYFVLDVDARAGGDAWWQAMIGVDSPPTDLICESGSGWPSAHYWFRRSPRLEGYHAKQVPHAPGVDLKGLPYGYVALPPTLHKSGKEYSWWDGCEPVNAEPPNPPRWLEDAILLASTPLTDAYVSFDMGLTFPRALELRAKQSACRPGPRAVRVPQCCAAFIGRQTPQRLELRAVRAVTPGRVGPHLLQPRPLWVG
jgi:hypothetical protein